MLISIIIPSKGERGFLINCLESCNNQTFKGSYEILTAKSEGNVSENLNAGIAQSKGEYIKIIADDDLLLPNCLQDLHTCIKYSGADFIHANAINFGATETVYVPDAPIPTLEQMAHRNRINGTTLMYKASVLKANLFDEKLWTGEEYELSLRLLSKGFKLGYCNNIVSKFRLHVTSKSYKMRKQQRRKDEIRRIQKLYL